MLEKQKEKNGNIDLQGRKDNMIINDSTTNWSIVRPDGVTIIIKPNQAYEPEVGTIVTIEKPE